MNDSRATNSVAVTLGGQGVTSRAGTLLVAELADRIGLTSALSRAMAPVVKRQRRRDPGVALTHLAVSLVDGGDCLSDLAVLRNEPTLFGEVASDATVFRLLDSGWAASAITDARRVARERAWAAGAAPTSVTIDIDATLLTSHSDKEEAAPNYKGGFGHHPLVGFCDETHEALAGLLRPGNAGANNAEDHESVLVASLEQLPEVWRRGHHEGDDPTSVIHPVLVRSDSAGATHRFVQLLMDSNLEFSVGFPIDAKVREALCCLGDESWTPAIELNGQLREGAFVAELTEFMDLSSWGEGLRLIARRERPHPGAQLTLFDTDEGFRHQVFLTNSTGEITGLELRHRGHARVEDRIRDAKSLGLRNLPFRDIVPNNAWFQLVLLGVDLMAWTKVLCLDDELATAEPKRLRFAFLHVAARVIHSARRVTLRIQSGWPFENEIVDAFARLRATPTLC
jgi:hypothetical protein